MKTQRFESLDGVRGFAALIVVLLHADDYLGREVVHHAYLMVDLFFLMSGFVLSAAYGERLAGGGMGFWFLRVRFGRLFPLAFIGLLIGAVVDVALQHAAHPPAAPPMLVTLTLTALFLPWLGGGMVAPDNPPAWSLILEIWGNAAYAWAAPYLTNRRLAAVVGLGAAALLATVVHFGDLSVGFEAHNFAGGLARVLFSFPAGILIHRLWASGRLAYSSAQPPMLLIPATVGLVAVAPKSGIFDLAAVVAIFPLLLLFAVNSPAVGRLRDVFVGMGRLSYPLYAIHLPVMLLCAMLTPPHASFLTQLGLITGAVLLSIAISWAAERWVDRPVRAWIAVWSAHRPRAPLADNLAA